MQPSNFNFAPRTAGQPPVAPFGATNMMSEEDFDRATDIEDAFDDDQSYYVEEEVTDDEAMDKQKADERAKRLAEDPDADSDDSDIPFYVPSAMGRSNSRDSPPTKLPEKGKKITKKIRVKKHKPTPSSLKKPPR